MAEVMKMLREDRKQQILDYITAQKSAQVKELSNILNVSVATIRRDLSEMEEEGLLRRVHGGAVSLDGFGEPPILQRKNNQSEEKHRIGEAAAALVEDGETIIITSGTTTEAMVPYLTNKNNLTVITNAVNVAAYLTRYPDISVIVLGGYLRHSEFSLVGHLTDQALQDLRAEKIFHGIFGLDPRYGLTGVDMQEVQTDRRIISAAGQLIILADHTKFHQVGPIRLAPIEVVSVVVTGQEALKDNVEALRAQGIQVIQA
jgi:DeoR/GlpR family transcriptional regulator of sugar metabolism